MDNSIRILSWIVEWKEEGIWYEADQRHAEIIVELLGLGEMNVRAEVPGEKLSVEEGDEDELSEGDIKRYQALVARANYLTQDRSDIQFCVKELARNMSSPHNTFLEAPGQTWEVPEITRKIQVPIWVPGQPGEINDLD